MRAYQLGVEYVNKLHFWQAVTGWKYMKHAQENNANLE